MNDFNKILDNLSEEELIDILASVDCVAWTEKIRRIKGNAFSFKGRNYLKDIYRDQSKEIVLLKGRQIEGTELSLNLALNFLSAHPYTNLAHVFPRQQQAENFSKQRLGTSISESAYLSNWYNEWGSNLCLRRFEKKTQNNAWNYYACSGSMAGGGGEAGDALRGMSLDMIIYDEWQDCNRDIAVVLGEGMSHSEFKRSVFLGTPKTSHDPLYTTWEISDQKEWMFICPKCGHAHIPRFELIINQGTEENEQWEYTCPDCGAYPLDRENGYWQAQKVGKLSGYHVTQLIVSWISANDIIEKKRNPLYSTKRFMNEVLGLPFVGNDMPITQTMLEQVALQYKLGYINRNDKNYYVGVDWGSKSWCTIWCEDGRLVDIFCADDIDNRQHPYQIVRFLRKYAKFIRKIVADNGPDPTHWKTLADLCAKEKICSKKKIFGCIYTNPPAQTEIKFNEETQRVTVGRTEIIDIIVDAIHDMKISLPALSWDIPLFETFRKHLCSQYVELNTNNANNQFLQYINNGDDHFLHSSIYAFVAMDSKFSGIVHLKLGDPILTNTNRNKKMREDPLAYIRHDKTGGYMKTIDVGVRTKNNTKNIRRRRR